MHGSGSLRWLDGSCVEEGGGDDEQYKGVVEDQGREVGLVCAIFLNKVSLEARVLHRVLLTQSLLAVGAVQAGGDEDRGGEEEEGEDEDGVDDVVLHIIPPRPEGCLSLKVKPIIIAQPLVWMPGTAGIQRREKI